MFDDQKLEVQKMGDGYGFFNYAVLHSTGLDHVFNFMRYNRAFLVRRADFERMLEAIPEYVPKWAIRKWSVLICRYDWKGKTKANWEEGMLLSDQELEQVTDPMTLVELSSDMIELRSPKKLKWHHVLEITGPLQWVLQVMYENHATPHEEADAHKIERAFHAPDEEFTVKLANYLSAVGHKWVMPPKP